MKTLRKSTIALAALAWLAGAQAQETHLAVQVDQPGPAISPYLYGQFIEHLGRCIHDGIWAEKLRDRKFLLAPTNSPWKMVRPEGAALEVFHDTAGAYAGDHCLALWRSQAQGGPAGIRQGDLGLVAGQEYVGYGILANASASPATVEIRLAWGEGPNAGQSVRVALARRQLCVRLQLEGRHRRPRPASTPVGAGLE
jgi:alpha-N-arabinofuranosidase